jgi:hypothetical protein
MRALIAILLSIVATQAAIYTPPASNTVAWIPGVTVGVEGGIPTGATMFTNAVLAGADPTGRTNCSTLMVTLVNACPSNQFVYWPKGKYLFTSAMNLGAGKNGKIIRGAGMSNTVFVSELQAGSMFLMGSSSPSGTNAISAGATKGSTNLTFSTTTGLGVGKLMRISSLNNADYGIHSVAEYQRINRQVVEIKAIAGSDVTIWPPLFWDHTGYSPEAIVYNNTCSMIGFEDFTLTCTNAANGNVAGGSAGTLFNLSNTKNWWIKNVLTKRPPAQAIIMQQTLFGEITGCVAWDAKNHTAGGGWLNADKDMCSALIYDNVGFRQAPFLEINHASSGNVFAYNFSTNALATDSGATNVAIGYDFDASHGAGNLMNLWEGNNGVIFIQDGYFGSSIMHTIFRNWFEGYDPVSFQYWRALDFRRFTRHNTVIGNVLGHPAVDSWIWTTTDNGWNISTVRPIYVSGFPNLGNTGYRGTAGVDYAWNDPGEILGSTSGTQRYGYAGDVTVTASSGNVVTGNFTNVQLGTINIAFKTAASGTNWTEGWYPTDGTTITATATNATTVTLNTSMGSTSFPGVTSGDRMFTVGPNAFQQLQADDSATHILHGNYHWATNWPDGTTQFDPAISETEFDESLYLSAKPGWYGTNVWPAFGYDVASVTNFIPARSRFNPNWATIPPGPTYDLTADATTTVTLAWAEVPDATEYKIYRSTEAESGFVNIATVSTESYEDSAVDGGEEYFYKVVTANVWDGAESSVVSATVDAEPPPPATRTARGVRASAGTVRKAN